MPIYEFRCDSCEHLFEKLCTMGEDGKNLECPKCGKDKPKRVMSSFNAKGKKTNNDHTEPLISSGCSSCASASCGSCGN